MNAALANESWRRACGALLLLVPIGCNVRVPPEPEPPKDVVRPRLVHKPVDFLEDERYLARSLDEEHAEEIRARLPYERVTLESSGCYGTCPIYSVELWRDGRALYHGREHVERIGDFEGVIAVPEFTRLCVFLERFAFEELAPRYSGVTFADGTGVIWTDDNTITIRALTRDGKEIAVADYGRVAPPEFQALQLLIEQYADWIWWERVR